MGYPARKEHVKGLSERLLDLLDLVDYRMVVTDAQREEIFRLRYDAYVRDHGIVPRFDKKLSDRYDDLDNTTIFALYIRGELATTIRCSIVTAEFPDCPAYEVFGDLIEPYLAAGQVLIDPTRMANNEAVTAPYRGLIPYTLMRIPWMLAEFYGADAFLGGVRAEHRAFYWRTFSFRQLGEARFYPGLVRPHYLTYGEYRAVRDLVEQRYPTFRSSAFERRMLFAPEAIAAHRAFADQPGRHTRPQAAVA